MTIRPTDQKDPERRESRGDRQIFLCDATAEAGRLLTALQLGGYSIVDVPLGLLKSRCHHELPEVIIGDADAHEAEARLSELSAIDLPGLKIVLLGHPDGALKRSATLRDIAHSLFYRPLDIDEVAVHIQSLCSAPRKQSHRPRVSRPGLMPNLVAAARKPYRSDGRFFETQPLHFEKEEPSDAGWPTETVPPSRRAALLDLPAHVESTYSSQVPPRAESSHPKLSKETAKVLAMGRRRLDSYSKQAARPVRLSVGAHTAAGDLRPELLAALEEPLDDPEQGARWEDEQPESTSPGTRNTSSGSAARELSALESSPPLSKQTGTTHTNDAPIPEIEERTNPGGRPGGTQPPDHISRSMVDAGTSEVEAMEDLSDLLSSPWSDPPPTHEPDSRGGDDLDTTKPPRRPGASPRPRVDLAPVGEDPMLDEGEFAQAPSLPASLFNHIHTEHRMVGEHRDEQHGPLTEQQQLGLGMADSQRGLGRIESNLSPLLSTLLAQCIRERSSGAVAQQEPGGIRRVLIMDGDITTVISAANGENLSHFLYARGDITREVLATLSGIPAFGRHAGAALIARGLLQQEDLWPVLRAHAEWILGLALGSNAPAVFEKSVPQRLVDEPAVFGGAAGAEIYLEALRRTLSPDQAFAILGGENRILGRGSATTLMGESALSAREQQAAWDALGQPLGPLMKREPRLIPLLLGLTQLGILTAGGHEVVLQPLEVKTRNSEIEDEAFVSKLTARMRLVDDGDYFALLGISRSATGYEVDRARDELLAIFSDTRLTARTVHLREDLNLLRATIEEAHLVLRDDVRRYRYKSALEAMPS